MSRYAFCALLAPGLAAAAAFPWALPEPTFVIPAIDSWSPAPTQAPAVGGVELLARAPAPEVCGYLSGISSMTLQPTRITSDGFTDNISGSSITCPNSGDSCATNTYYRAHGCCPSGSLSSCTIPTTCIPSSLMSASCKDKSCSDDNFTAKCTASSAPECYEHHYVYATRDITLTEYGCAAEATTATIERTYSGYIDPNSSTEPIVSTETTTKTATPSASVGATPLSATQSAPKSNNTPAIIGGTIGGLVIVGTIITLIVFLLLRDRKAKREAAAQSNWTNNPSEPTPAVTEYNPDGFSPISPWQQKQDRGWKPGSPDDCGVEGGFRYGQGNGRGRGDGATLFGVVETAGTPLHEAPS
jgi:hypothetical protein